jgi:mannose-6-phosphate isomerase
MAELYPLKFDAILKEKVWGGSNLKTQYNKVYQGTDPIGESWEISSLEGDKSVISNGFLAGNNIQELIEVYMGDIVGDFVYEKFGDEFPLLIKFIEAKEDLSIQVHPGNELAKERHNAYGKTEMWYILDCNNKSKILTGFNKNVTRDIIKEAIKNDNITDFLHPEYVEKGDTIFIPAGTIHSIGSGITLVEIQQTSDITYRIYDWNRKNTGKKKRELHTELALDTINYELNNNRKIQNKSEINKTDNLVSCEFFNTNILRFNKPVNKDYYEIDSFVVYICIDGSFLIRWDNSQEKVSKGETVLIPAMLNEVILEPEGEAKLLEVYITENT